jgi:hypothetical protein
MTAQSRTIKLHLIILPLFALLLNGCLLMSGGVTSTDTQAAAGNLSASFVSAEGQDERTLDVGEQAQLSVITIVSVAQGQLRVDILDPNGSVVLSVQGRPNEQVTRSGTVQTDANGELHYRVVAQGARNGSYQVLYQKTGT